MAFQKSTSGDTRGWRPKETENQKLPPAGSRCGENQTPRAVVDIQYPTDAARIAESDVPMDNMGNSPSNNGKNITPRALAETVDSAPDVPLSSYAGVAAGEGGIGIDGGFAVQPAERELREKKDHAQTVPNIVAGEITSGHPKFNQATIPGGFETVKKGLFTNDGSNPSNVESKVMGDEIAPKQTPEFSRVVRERKK
jgi:hypothetical protein